MFFLSAKGTSSFRILKSFLTGTDSPVKADSFTSKLCSVTILQSAGILSPSSNLIRSPGTKSEDLTSFSWLFLYTIV